MIFFFLLEITNQHEEKANKQKHRGFIVDCLMKKKTGNLISHPLPQTAPEESFSLVGGKRLFLRSIVPQPLWLTKRKVSITILKSKFECSGEVSFSKYRFHFENLVLKFLYIVGILPLPFIMGYLLVPNIIVCFLNYEYMYWKSGFSDILRQ